MVPSDLVYSQTNGSTEILLILLLRSKSFSMESNITQGGTIGYSVLKRQPCHRDTSVLIFPFREHLNGKRHCVRRYHRLWCTQAAAVPLRYCSFLISFPRASQWWGALPSDLVNSNINRAIEMLMISLLHFRGISMESDITWGGIIGVVWPRRQPYYWDPAVFPISFWEHLSG